MTVLICFSILMMTHNFMALFAQVRLIYIMIYTCTFFSAIGVLISYLLPGCCCNKCNERVVPANWDVSKSFPILWALPSPAVEANSRSKSDN